MQPCAGGLLAEAPPVCLAVARQRCSWALPAASRRAQQQRQRPGRQHCAAAWAALTSRPCSAHACSDRHVVFDSSMFEVSTLRRLCRLHRLVQGVPGPKRGVGRLANRACAPFCRQRPRQLGRRAGGRWLQRPRGKLPHRGRPIRTRRWLAVAGATSSGTETAYRCELSEWPQLLVWLHSTPKMHYSTPDQASLDVRTLLRSFLTGWLANFVRLLCPFRNVTRGLRPRATFVVRLSSLCLLWHAESITTSPSWTSRRGASRPLRAPAMPMRSCSHRSSCRTTVFLCTLCCRWTRCGLWSVLVAASR